MKLEVRQVVQEYPAPDGQGTHRVLDGIDLTLEGPGVHMLLGPSGCGKSTLLRMLGGVRPLGVTTPSSGSVLLDGEPVVGAHPDAVMVFQRYLNRPDLSVWDNVAFPFRFSLWKARVPPAEQKERIEQALDAVGLLDKRGHRPSQLSGGQNQRVALARALVVRPRILLADEPFGALDAQIRREMQDLITELIQRYPCLVVFVTHDITEALLLGDRVTVLSTPPARVAADLLIAEPRPRSETWLRSTEATRMSEQIIELLRGSGHGAGGQVRVTV